MPDWQLSDRTLELDPARPLGAGIVNVTTDSMYAGARSGTPEQAVTDGVALAEAGFGLIDVGAVPARSGPAVEARPRRRCSFPPSRAWRELGPADQPIRSTPRSPG